MNGDITSRLCISHQIQTAPPSPPPSLATNLWGRCQDLRARDVFKTIDEDVGVGIAPGEGAVFL